MSQIHEVTVTMTNDEFKLYREWLDGHKSQEEILMTTTDFIEIRKGNTESLYRVNINDWTIDLSKGCPECISYDTKNYKWFYYQSRMHEWIVLNRPMFSIVDIENKILGTQPAASPVKQRLITEVKTKLKL